MKKYNNIKVDLTVSTVYDITEGEYNIFCDEVLKLIDDKGWICVGSFVNEPKTTPILGPALSYLLLTMVASGTVLFILNRMVL